jgi:hypothetical protein
MRNTSLTGEVCRTQISTALALQGKIVLWPLGDFQRYDLVFDDGGRFYRVQCKMGRLANGAIQFHPCSVDSRSQKGTCIRKGYAGEVEFFGVYCPELKKCYLIPVEDVPITQCCLRFEPPRNRQKTRIRWAMSYEMRSDPFQIEEADLT